MNNVRSIVLIGNTGNGKSTLGNVLVNKNGNFEEVFGESSSGVSHTKYVSEESFWWNGINYRVIDTIGIGDTKLTKKEVLGRIARAVRKVRDGLSQILFVTSGRFTEQEIEAYKVLKDYIFDADIVNYTTIVRTNFPNFRNHSKCEEDKRLMIEENYKLRDIITSCGNRVIHVDNSPMNIDDERRLVFNREDREYSRSKLLSHLAQFQIPYKPANLDYLNERIDGFMTDTEKLEKELNETKELSEEQRKILQDRIDELMREVVRETNRGIFQKVGKAIDDAIFIPFERFSENIEIRREGCKIM